MALIDEVDLVLHPLRSELNFPIGERIELVLHAFPDPDAGGGLAGGSAADEVGAAPTATEQMRNEADEGHLRQNEC